MLKGLFQAAAGMKVRMAAQDIIANNLANAATDGFQREIGSIRARLFPNVAAPAAAGVAGVPHVEVMETTSAADADPGVLKPTGSNADLALEGSGYLVVQTNAGPRLVRGGTFHTNSRGILATADGDPLLGTDNRTFPVGERDWNVTEDGTVTAGGSVLGRLRIVRPNGEIRREGARLLSVAGTSAVSGGAVRVRQGFLEHSNVDPVREMVDMIAGVRAYETSQRAVLAQDETLQRLLEAVK